MTKEINHEWVYEQSPAEVWAYLTQPELIAKWLMPNNFKLEPGHEFQLTTKPMPALQLDGIMHCKVMDIVPLERLSYTWKGGSGDGVITLDTLVEWTLIPYGSGTKLILKHSGFKEYNADIFIGMTDGWLKKMDQMLAIMISIN